MAMQHTPLLMSNILDRGATIAPNEEIVTMTETGVRRQTYKQTRDRAHQLAHALAAAGIKVGDRVGTFMWNGSRHLEAYHACAGMGAVLHTLNVRLGENDLDYIINHAEDQVIIVDADILPLLEKMDDEEFLLEKMMRACPEWYRVDVDNFDFVKSKRLRQRLTELRENECRLR